MRTRFTFYTCLAAVLSICFSSCKKEYASIEEEDAANIEQYLKTSGLTMHQYNNTGVYYSVLTQGSGTSVDFSDMIYATYTLKSIDGKFKSSNEYSNLYADFLGYLGPNDARGQQYPETIRDIVRDVLKNKGGSIRFIIPSHKAFGRSGKGDIPGNASLDFTLNLFDVDSQGQFDEALIKKFAAQNSLSLVKDSTGLYYQILSPGTGDFVLTDTTEVTVNYKLRYLDGYVQDATKADKPAKFVLREGIISGFRRGVSLVKKGGKIRFFLPFSLGYETPEAAIENRVRPNHVLDYEVELIDVK